MAQKWDKKPCWTNEEYLIFQLRSIGEKKNHRKKARFMKPTDKQIIGVFNHLLGML